MRVISYYRIFTDIFALVNKINDIVLLRIRLTIISQISDPDWGVGKFAQYMV